nr:unnamed protein product [Digitaria exilis]
MMKVVASILFFLILGGLTPFPAAADVCDNIKQVAATLPKNTSSSPLHFATTTFGQAPDIVYALALCRGDILNDTVCGNCVADLFGKISNWTLAPQQKCYTAVSYYAGPCTLVFSGDDILAPSNTTAANGDDPPFTLWNDKSIPGDAGEVQLIVGLKQELLVETVKKAAAAEPRRFATGIMDSGTTFPPVYSLAQCTPDLSACDCLACLQNLLGMVNSTMELRMGAQIHVIRCYFRYETYVFYDSLPMVQIGASSAEAPAPTPTTPAKRRMSKLWVIPIVVVPLAAAAAFLCFIFYSPWFKRYRKGKEMRLKAGSKRTQDLLQGDGKNSDFSVFDFEQMKVEEFCWIGQNFCGYMAPEYASEGIFSIKSDVFSFGVLVLEILSGKRNSGSQQCGGFINLIGYVS